MVKLSSFVRGQKEWQSEHEEKGFLALFQYLTKRKGRLNDDQCVWSAIAWLIQKDHEAQEWFVNLIGDHVRRLEDEIKKLSENTPGAVEKADLIARLDASEATVAVLEKQVAKLMKAAQNKKG